MSSEPKKLTEWAVACNPYAAPEIRLHRLFGRLECGKRIRTSVVVAVLDERTVRTESGTIYTLSGPADAEAELVDTTVEEPLGDVARCLKIQEGQQARCRSATNTPMKDPKK